ncbi:hypothetical protein RIF29_03852 [Crotalaria pallida]|uniref:Uncharacterized protein n=1 Tax=Crotalaria pallida TaxID=3830 RepID=A0AAN9J145_CROPI
MTTTKLHPLNWLLYFFSSCPVGSTIEGDLLSPWSFERSCHSVKVASFFGSGDRLGLSWTRDGDCCTGLRCAPSCVDLGWCRPCWLVQGLNWLVQALLAGAGAEWLAGEWADLVGALTSAGADLASAVTTLVLVCFGGGGYLVLVCFGAAGALFFLWCGATEVWVGQKFR